MKNYSKNKQNIVYFLNSLNHKAEDLVESLLETGKHILNSRIVDLIFAISFIFGIYFLISEYPKGATIIQIWIIVALIRGFLMWLAKD